MTTRNVENPACQSTAYSCSSELGSRVDGTYNVHFLGDAFSIQNPLNEKGTRNEKKPK
jgi:hypothetical protein